MRFRHYLILVVVVLVTLVLAWSSRSLLMGVNGWGPRNVIERATVLNTHVDTTAEGTHYMVGTDQGTFEIDNGWVLGVSDADRIFGSLQRGATYRLEIKGREWVGYFVGQHYRYITKATLVAEDSSLREHPLSPDELAVLNDSTQRVLLGYITALKAGEASSQARQNARGALSPQPTDTDIIRDLREQLRVLLD